MKWWIGFTLFVAAIAVALWWFKVFDKFAEPWKAWGKWIGAF
jgi:hypothetical protein